MQGHAVKNPIKVGRVFILRGRHAYPSVAAAVDGTWVELLNCQGETRRIELVTLGRATSLPGYAATEIDLGGLVEERASTFHASRGVRRGPPRVDRATAQQDLRVLLLAALLEVTAQQHAHAGQRTTHAGTLTRHEAAELAQVRPQAIDHYRARGAFTWRVEDGRVVIEVASFEAWLLARLQRQQEREQGGEHG